MKKTILSVIAFILGLGSFSLLLSLENVYEASSFNGKYDPFLSEQEYEELLDQPFLTSENIFTPWGEFFSLDRGAKLDLKVREVLEGEIFWGRGLSFSSPLSFKDIPRPFTFSEINSANYLKSGPLFIFNTGSDVLINRDYTYTEILNQGHALDIYYEGALRPFVLPSGMKVKIYDTLINEKTSQLFYSKLRKDFQMQIVSNLPDFFREAQTDLSNKKNQVLDFAHQSQEGLLYFPESEFLEKIKSRQEKWAFGLTQKRKDQRDFSVFVEPLFVALKALEQGDAVKAEQNLDQFLYFYQKPEFFEILQRNPSLRKSWETFLRSHRSWVSTLGYEDPHYRMVLFWNHQNQSLSAIGQLEKIFFNIEKFLVSSDFQNAQKELQAFEKNLSSFSGKSEDAFLITRFRRLIVEILKSYSDFHTSLAFDVHRQLIQKEISLHSDEDYQGEIILENSKDIIWFIQYFLNYESVGNPLADVMITYRTLNVQNVQKNLGVSVFTESEKELIEVIKTLGNAQVTPDGLKRIRESYRQEKEKEKAINLPPPPTENTPFQRVPELPAGALSDRGKLETFFQEKGAMTKRIQVKNEYSSHLGRYAVFSGVYWNAQAVRGIFYYDIQRFQPLTIGNQQIDSIDPSLLSRWLDRQSSPSSAQTSSEKVANAVPQNTQNALEKRSTVESILNQYGFKTSRSQISILDREESRFKVTETSLTGDVKVSFAYNIKTQNIFDIVLHHSSKDHRVPVSYLRLSNAWSHLQNEALSLQE